MALSSEDKERFLSFLRADQGFREAVRRELLTAELVSLPERFAVLADQVHALTGSVDALTARVDELTARVDELTARVDAFVEATDRRLGFLERQVTRLADDYGDLRRLVLKQQVRQNPGYYLHKYARRIHVMSIDQLLDEPGASALSEEEQDVLARTDVLARGVSRESGRAVFLVVEATWRPHSGDVEREVTRRDILTSKGVETLAIIVPKKPATESVRHLAEVSGVVLDSAEPEDPTEAA
jgi:cell division protein FtsB